METKRTTKGIIAVLKEIVENREKLNPEAWVDGALALNLLVGDEHEKMVELQQKVAQMELEALQNSNSVAAAKLKVKSTDEYKEMRRQELLIKQVEEYIRIAKLQARIRDLN